jgi:hypothetical protein
MRRLALLSFVLAGCGSLLGFSGDDDDEVTQSGSADAATNDRTGILDGAGDVTTNVTDDSGGGKDSAADVTIASRRRAVFVTQKTVTGAFGGLTEGDEVCKGEANDAGLGGTFVAWLSTSTVDAKSRLVTDAGWYLLGPDAGAVFTGPSAIANGSFPKVPITRDARGQNVDGGVWTGTRQDGTTYASDCTGWKTTSGTGVPGLVGAQDETWTGAAPDFCNVTKRLICFEK